MYFFSIFQIYFTWWLIMAVSFSCGKDLGQGHTHQEEGDLGHVQETEEGQGHHRGAGIGLFYIH